MGDKLAQFTLEEIYFIRNCGNDNKRETVRVFKKYLNFAKKDLAEIIQNSIKKIQELSEEEFRELRNYPV